MKQSETIHAACRRAVEFIQATAVHNEASMMAVLLLAEQRSLTSWRRRIARCMLVKFKGEQSLKELFSILVLVQQELPEHVTGERIATAIRALTMQEVRPGGPYGSEKDDDLMTNLLIYRFLDKLEAVPDGLKAYVENLRPRLTQYSDEKMRVLSGICVTGIISSVYSNMSDTELVARQNPDGSWGKGSERLLQTALALRQLSDTSQIDELTEKRISLQNAVYALAEKEFAVLGKDIARVAKKVLAEIQQVDSRGEIVLITLFFHQSWQPDGPNLSSVRTLRYGLANVLLWVSYTIYDDFMDEEGAPELLPLANIAHRKVLELYRQLAPNAAFYKTTVVGSFNIMDKANNWELQHTRFLVKNGSIEIGELPDYGGGRVLAQRAFGHIIGPLLELRQSKLGHAQQLSIQRGLEQYLIARQLNDDIHDWKKDLTGGQITLVVAHLLRHANISRGYHNLDELIAQIEEYFWQNGFEEINKLIILSCKSARRSLSTGGVGAGGPLINLISVIEESVQRSEEVYKNQQSFLRHYQSA